MMATELSFTKRAAAELSRCFNGLSVNKNSSTITTSTTTITTNASSNTSSSSSNNQLNQSNGQTSFADQMGSSGSTNAAAFEKQTSSDQLKKSSSLSASGSSIVNGSRSTAAEPSTDSSSATASVKSKTSGFFTLANSVRSIGNAYERNIQAAKTAAQNSFRLASGGGHTTTATPTTVTTTLATTTTTSTATTASKDSAISRMAIEAKLQVNDVLAAISTPPTPRRSAPRAPPKSLRARRQNFLLKLAMQTPSTMNDIWESKTLMKLIFEHVTPAVKLQLVQVCKLWRNILYSDTNGWNGYIVKIDYMHLRQTTSAKQRADMLRSLPARAFDSILVYGAQDAEMLELATALGPFYSLRYVTIRSCGCIDSTLQQLLSNFGGRLLGLELISCNELSDGAHWSTLCPQLRQLAIEDCINVADETIAAIGQTLPKLVHLTIQAYHVTDQCFQFLRQNAPLSNNPDEIEDEDDDTGLRTLKMNSCWELSNQAVLQITHCLPHLRNLSLSGCSKITDEAVELISEQMRCLRHLDLSWCARITDTALEYLACDLADSLAELIIDRCSNITDIGLGYISTITRLEILSIRWCIQVRDFGLQSICVLPALKSLSLAGCSMITPNALSMLKQCQMLQELELTNCPAATAEVIIYLKQQLPKNCAIIK